MPYLKKLETHTDSRGSLTVVEKELPFEVKRLYYIYNLDGSIRGKHRHKKTIQAAVAVNGSCSIYCQSPDGEVKEFKLTNPNECLVIMPEDYHWMKNFTPNTVLLVLASELFDSMDYIYKAYE